MGFEWDRLHGAIEPVADQISPRESLFTAWYTTKKLSIFALSDGIAENPPHHAANGPEGESRMTGFLPYRRKKF